MTLIDSPNKSKPVLTLARRSIALDAYKAKLKLVAEPETSAAPHSVAASGHGLQPQLVDGPSAGAIGIEPEVRESELNPDVAGGLHVQANGREDQGLVAPSRPARKPKRRPPAPSFIPIEGDPVPPPEGQEHTAGSWEEVTKWIWKISKDLVRDIPEGRRKAARKFVASNRRAIADAFERRLCRKDVVAALGAMFEQTNQSELLRVEPDDGQGK